MPCDYLGRSVGADLEHRDTMADSISWQRDLDAATAEAKESGKLVLLDFSAAPM
jgi:hypothetical protein